MTTDWTTATQNAQAGRVTKTATEGCYVVALTRASEAPLVRSGSGSLEFYDAGSSGDLSADGLLKRA